MVGSYESGDAASRALARLRTPARRLWDAAAAVNAIPEPGWRTCPPGSCSTSRRSTAHRLPMQDALVVVAEGAWRITDLDDRRRQGGRSPARRLHSSPRARALGSVSSRSRRSSAWLRRADDEPYPARPVLTCVMVVQLAQWADRRRTFRAPESQTTSTAIRRAFEVVSLFDRAVRLTSRRREPATASSWHPRDRDHLAAAARLAASAEVDVPCRIGPPFRRCNTIVRWQLSKSLERSMCAFAMRALFAAGGTRSCAAGTRLAGSSFAWLTTLRGMT